MVSTDEVKEGCEALDMAQEEAMEIMARLLDIVVHGCKGQ